MSDSSKGKSSHAKKARRRRMEIQRLRSGGTSSSPELTSELETHSKNPANSSAESSGSGETMGMGATREEEIGGRGKGWSENKLADGLVYGYVSMMGRRRVMKDAVTVERVAGEYFFFAVYDGHGGAKVAETCSERLHNCLEKNIHKEKNMTDDHEKEFDWKRVMVVCFKAMDEEFEGEDMIGSTAVVVLVGKENMVVANCWDSRAVLCRGGVPVPLSRDHKSKRAEEKDRVEDAGGRITNWRVQGLLPTSRSIGSHYLKSHGISEPEVSIERRTESDKFLIIATDGLWDLVSNEVACEVVKGRIHDGLRSRQSEASGGASEAAAILVELAIAKGSRDNITVIVVQFK